MAAGINPIPDTQISRVFGLLEVLDDRGGREDGYKLARDLNYKFDDLLRVMKAAEIMGLVETPQGDVVLADLGRKFLDTDINQRKLIIRGQIKELGLFAYFVRILQSQEDKSFSREVVLEHIAMLLPNEKPDRIFAAMVNWGRFAELFGYNKDEDRFYLDQE
ncbi:MAG TPA: AAA-associated domain-containing protein [Candidatus Binataceae bacterium]